MLNDLACEKVGNEVLGKEPGLAAAWVSQVGQGRKLSAFRLDAAPGLGWQNNAGSRRCDFPCGGAQPPGSGVGLGHAGGLGSQLLLTNMDSFLLGLR